MKTLKKKKLRKIISISIDDLFEYDDVFYDHSIKC